LKHLKNEVYFRVSGVFWNNGGEVENSFLDRNELAFDQYAARLKFSYDANDQLQIRLGGQFANIETAYAPWQLFDVEADALSYAQSKDPATEDNPYDHHTSFDLPGYVDHTTNLVHLAADYSLNDNHTLTAILGHANLVNKIYMDFDVSAADLSKVFAHHDYSQDSLELRSNGRFSMLGIQAEYIAGVFGFQSDMYLGVDVAAGADLLDFGLTPAGAKALGGPDLGILGPLLVGLPVPPVDLMDGLAQTFIQDSQSIAAFGQITWFLTDHLSFITGLRVGREEKDAVLDVSSRGLGITALLLGANNPPNTDFSESLQRREAEVSPKLGLSYEFNDDVTLYSSWTRGYKGGGFNASSFNSENLEFEPEQGDSYELGVKSRLFDDSVALNMTLYHTIVTNMQVVSFTGFGFDVFNAAESVLEGFEADLSWLTPLEWLSLNAALAISSAEYEAYPEGPQTSEQASNCNADLGDECVQDLSGKTLPKAPTITASLSPVVNLPLSSSLGMEIGADISYRGEQYLALDLDPHSYQEAHTLIGARISVGDLDEIWSLTLRGTNLTDVKALSFVADHNLYADSYFATQIPSRSLSLSLSVNW
jgi:iron complex outermembrane receptor protein